MHCKKLGRKYLWTRILEIHDRRKPTQARLVGRRVRLVATANAFPTLKEAQSPLQASHFHTQTCGGTANRHQLKLEGRADTMC
jgi:hypothetical protein